MLIHSSLLMLAMTQVLIPGSQTKPQPTPSEDAEETAKVFIISAKESNSGINEHLPTWKSITSKDETESLAETTTSITIVETVEEAETKSDTEDKAPTVPDTDSPMVAKTENPTTPNSESLITTEKETDPATESPAVDENGNSATSLKVCPGVCVPPRNISLCEATLNLEGLCGPELHCCGPDLHCCVAADLFESVDNPPTEFVILARFHPKKKGSEEVKASTTDKSTTTTTTTTTTTSKPTTRAATTELTTVSTQKQNGATTLGPSIPTELFCKGHCVTDYSTFLCVTIDRSAACPLGKACCTSLGFNLKNNSKYLNFSQL